MSFPEAPCAQCLGADESPCHLARPPQVESLRMAPIPTSVGRQSSRHWSYVNIARCEPASDVSPPSPPPPPTMVLGNIERYRPHLVSALTPAARWMTRCVWYDLRTRLFRRKSHSEDNAICLSGISPAHPFGNRHFMQIRHHPSNVAQLSAVVNPPPPDQQESGA